MLPHVLLVQSGPAPEPDPANVLRAAGCQVIPATGPEAADALAVPGLDYLLLDLTNPSLDLPALRALLRPGVPTRPDPLDGAERRHIAAALRYTRGNRREAARLLGIARSTLLAKIRKYGLEGMHAG